MSMGVKDGNKRSSGINDDKNFLNTFLVKVAVPNEYKISYNSVRYGKVIAGPSTAVM